MENTVFDKPPAHYDRLAKQLPQKYFAHYRSRRYAVFTRMDT